MSYNHRVTRSAC